MAQRPVEGAARGSRSGMEWRRREVVRRPGERRSARRLWAAAQEGAAT
jgi:hypothetical protein